VKSGFEIRDDIEKLEKFLEEHFSNRLMEGITPDWEFESYCTDTIEYKIIEIFKDILNLIDE